MSNQNFLFFQKLQILKTNYVQKFYSMDLIIMEI